MTGGSSRIVISLEFRLLSNAISIFPLKLLSYLTVVHLSLPHFTSVASSRLRKEDLPYTRSTFSLYSSCNIVDYCLCAIKDQRVHILYKSGAVPAHNPCYQRSKFGSLKMTKRKDSASKDDAITWTRQMDDALIDAFAYQNNLGNRVGGTFTSKAYDLILKELSEKFPDIHFDKEKIKNRMKYIKKNFVPCFDIFKNGLSGFAWNSATCTWCAEPEVWQKLIEVHPEAEKWMRKPVHNYNKLASLFGNDRAIGDIAETTAEARERLANLNHPLETEIPAADTIDEIDSLISQNHVILEGHNLNVEPSLFDRTNEERSSSKKKQKTNKLKEDDIVMLHESFKYVAEAIIKSTENLVKSNQRLQIPENEIWTHLEELQLDEETKKDAYLYLTENPPKLGAFLGCPILTRKSILLKMLESTKNT